MRGKMPNAAKNQAWRLASGNAYPGNTLIAILTSGTVAASFAVTLPGAAFTATQPGIAFVGD